jgi:hypothetical protein
VKAADTWTARGVFREVLFFPSGPDRLYGSLYVDARGRGLPGAVICPSWGFEMATLASSGHMLAWGLARAGGAGFLFHPPGHGDSTGRADGLDLRRLVGAALDAREAALERRPDRRWGFAGVGLGASVAAVAAEAVDSDVLALIQPSLDPGRYFRRLLAGASRGGLSASGPPDVAFGHPIPAAMLDGENMEPARALGRFAGRTIAVVMAPSSPDPLPEQVQAIRVRGRWRQPLPDRDAARLVRPVVDEWVKAGRP